MPGRENREHTLLLIHLNLSLACSDDSGKTWPYSWLVTEEDYAYSCLTHVDSPEQVGLLWETGAASCTGPSCQLVFSKITVL